MERRDDKRRARRVPVRFWKKGEEKARQGFTTNISHGGMFIGSNQVFGRGARLRIEVLDPANSFMVEGIVMRASRSQLHMQHVRASGMGIRFLQVGELVEELFPTSQKKEASVEAPPPEPSRSSAGAPPVPDAAVGGLTRFSYALQYRSREELQAAFERDISQGGLFISTPSPAPLQEVVIIEIGVQGVEVDPVRLRAKVVHATEPQGENEGNLLAGMGLELLDPARVRSALAPLMG